MGKTTAAMAKDDKVRETKGVLWKEGRNGSGIGSPLARTAAKELLMRPPPPPPPPFPRPSVHASAADLFLHGCKSNSKIPATTNKEKTFKRESGNRENAHKGTPTRPPSRQEKPFQDLAASGVAGERAFFPPLRSAKTHPPPPSSSSFPSHWYSNVSVMRRIPLVPPPSPLFYNVGL